MPHSSLVIANEFIRRGLEPGARALTNMQIQKLVYLAHGWNLGAFGDPLIEDPVEAWKFGPVIRRIYSALSKYGSSPVSREICWGEDTVFFSGDDDEEVAREDLTADEQSVVEVIWEQYGTYPAYKLSALTHEPDTPWSAAYRQAPNKVISNDEIRAYFQRKLAA